MDVPSGPDDVVVTNGTWEQLDALIRSDECLSSHRGQIAPRNCSRAPWSESLDLRFAQDIPIKNSKLQLTLDLANFLNLLDEDSGHLRFVNFSTVSVVSYSGVSEDGKPIYGLNSVVTNPESRFQLHNIRPPFSFPAVTNRLPASLLVALTLTGLCFPGARRWISWPSRP